MIFAIIVSFGAAIAFFVIYFAVLTASWMILAPFRFAVWLYRAATPPPPVPMPKPRFEPELFEDIDAGRPTEQTGRIEPTLGS